MKFDPTLYLVTDSSLYEEDAFLSVIDGVCSAGITLLQLREKELSEADFEQEAKELLELCHKYNVNLIINDNVALAAKVGADGVHIGQSDMGVEKARAILGKEKIIGVTAKTVEQAKAAEAAGADYLGSGAVFGTSTKKDAKPMDHALLQEICENVKIPVVAIGGIDGGNILLLKGRKMAGVAVVSGLFACEDIKKAAEDLREKADRICE